MNRTPDVDLVLRDYFADDGVTAPDYVLDVVEQRISRQSRRRVWPFPGRTTNMTTQIKLIGALAAAIVVAVVGYNLLPGTSGPGSQTAAPTATATATPAATEPVVLADGVLTAGKYIIEHSFGDSGPAMIFDIPAGWIGFPEVPAVTSRGGENNGILIGFMKGVGLFSDPCHWDLDGTGATDQPGDVAIGSGVDGLVAALKANDSYTSSAPKEITLGQSPLQYKGQELELQLPGDDVIRSCDKRPGETTGDYFVFPNGFYALSPNSRWHLYIVWVEGTQLITLASIAEGVPEADVTAADAIVRSMQFTP